MNEQFTNREASIYLFALRYAMPRKTGAIDFVCQEITRNIERFSARDREQMRQEISLDGMYRDCEQALLKIL